MASYQIKVDGTFLATYGGWGDLEWVDGQRGTESIAWAMPASRRTVLKGAFKVEVYYGAMLVAAGRMLEPDRESGDFNAKGIAMLGDDYKALDAGGAVTTKVDTAVDQAIARGLPWVRPDSISTTDLSTDTLGEIPTVTEILDAWADDNNKRWAVTPAGVLYTYTDPTAATYHMLRTVPLAVSREQFASTLFGRIRTSTGGYATRSAVDTDAETRFGHKEETVDMTGLGYLTNVKADNMLSNMLKKGRARLGYANSIEAGPGDLLSAGGVPVDVNTVTAAELKIRLHNLWDDTRDLHGQLYHDVLIERVIHKQGDKTIELQPVQMDAVSLEDLIASLPKR